MNKLFFVLTTILILGCAKDDLQAPQSPVLSLQESIEQITTEAEALSFLQKHHPEFGHDQIEEIREMLHPTTSPNFKRSGNTVELPAGSMNGLQAAIDEAGEGGTVIIKAGEHTETGLVTASHEIHIQGEDGAVLTFENPIELTLAVTVTAGLHLFEASRSTIRDLQVSGGDGSGNFLLIENSHNVGVHNSVLTNFQFNITVEKSNNTRVSGTTIAGWTGWLQGESEGGSLGITVINGRGSSLVGNTISGCQFGQWLCDKGGVSWGNTTTGNYYGQILCNVPANSVFLPSGEPSGSINPGQNWLVALNNDFNNFYAGIVVIDGANTNTLLANKGGGNAAYDLELTTDTERFGFLTPKAYNNYVFSSKGYSIKDCGDGNKVSGGTKVDTGADPCN